MDDRQLIADLLSALEYHTEQTRPIEFSKVAIEAAREYLQKPEQPAQQEYASFAEWAHDYVQDNLHKLKPAQQEPVAWMNPNGGMLTANYINNFASGLDKEIHNIPLYTSPPAQRKPLTLGQKQRLWSSVGDKPTLKDRVNAYGLAIEAAHGIKEQK